jgi:hypothetical protein
VSQRPFASFHPWQHMDNTPSSHSYSRSNSQSHHSQTHSPSFDLDTYHARNPTSTSAFDSPINLRSHLTGPGGADLSLSELSLEDFDSLPQRSGSGSHEIAAGEPGRYGHGYGSRSGSAGGGEDSYASHREEPFSLFAPKKDPGTGKGSRSTTATTTNSTSFPASTTKTRSDPQTRDREYDRVRDLQEEDLTSKDDDLARQSQLATNQTREEKLQSDLLVLRKLNSTLTGYLESLSDAKVMTEVCNSSRSSRFAWI